MVPVYELFRRGTGIPYLEVKQKLDVPGSIVVSPQKVVELLDKAFRVKELYEERIWQLAIDNAGTLLGVFEVSHGSTSASIIDMKSLFVRALLCGASSMVLVHNHPSFGVPEPSREDILITRNAIDVGKLHGLPLVDHVIIGGNGRYYSFRERQGDMFK